MTEKTVILKTRKPLYTLGKTAFSEKVILYLRYCKYLKDSRPVHSNRIYLKDLRPVE